MVSIMLATAGLKANPNYEANGFEFAVTPPLSDDQIDERLAQLQLPFAVHNTPRVQAYIRRYFVEGYRDAEDLLGLTTVYFPIFEHYLRLYNLPDELKYLPLIESTLRPRVTSPAGAAGLWQFVPSTARHYGLIINGSVDERLDPHKATEAAVRMLAALYQQFGDWGLVLAAYNCGPGRVQQAMRNARCEDFWDVQPYLPRESQRYVPGFIAAAYLVNYYNLHGLAPDYPDYDLQDTRTFRVFDRMNLSQVAGQLGVDYRTLYQLNPSFLQGVVPASRDGHFVTVPARVADGFQARYGQTGNEAGTEGRLRTTYTVVAGDRIETLALLFQCTPEDIMRWNGLRVKEVIVNQPLTVFLPRGNARP